MNPAPDRAGSGRPGPEPAASVVIEPGMPICQSDYPLDRYQPEFLPYAEEYLALPDRTPESVIPWMESYIRPVVEEYGDALLLCAHYYMGGEIVQLVERFGGRIADSYQLALASRDDPCKKVIIESAIHFPAAAR